jgi:OmpA-OmpF porin, OOP family
MEYDGYKEDAKMKLLSCIVFFYVTGCMAFAQSGKDFTQLEGWIGLGSSYYKGEIGSKVTRLQPAFDVGLRYFMNNRVAGQAHILYANLKGDDMWVNKNRGYSFSTHLGELSGNIEVYMLKEGSKFQRYSSYKGGGSNFNAFLSIGAGIVLFSPQTFNNETLVDFTEEYYDKSSYILAFGGGVRYNFNKDWAVAFNVNQRLTITDYLDGFSEDANTKDMYLTGMLNIIYKFNKSPY